MSRQEDAKVRRQQVAALPASDGATFYLILALGLALTAVGLIILKFL